MEKRFTIGMIVSNHFGVLNHITGLYRKRGYNIDSLAVGPTEDATLSRITVVSTGDDYEKIQIIKQLRKMVDVKKAVFLEDEQSLSVEHLLIKITANGSGNKPVSDLISSYSGRILDFGQGYVTAEVTGESAKISEFIETARSLGIIELCRSGAIALTQGIADAIQVSAL